MSLYRKQVIYLPVEPLEERYTAQMLAWVQNALSQLNVPYKTLMPGSYKSIEHGQWLDTYGATHYRLKQLDLLVNLFERGEIHSDDVILLGDAWYPGIENIRLIAELSGVHVRIYGWHYAGVFDPADLLARSLGMWARGWERWLLESIDGFCVGSVFHKTLLEQGAGRSLPNVYPLGLAWEHESVQQYAQNSPKEPIVVFPHRLAPEKGFDLFLRAARALKGQFRFVFSTNNAHLKLPLDAAGDVELVRHKTKADYYRFLGTCAIYFSAATQETFGYSLHESIALGLDVVAPNRCSYAEVLPARNLYNTEEGALAKLRTAMDNPTPVPVEVTARYSGAHRRFIERIVHV